ncbi:T9SS type A sorting domain-containing protein [bacterium]|nr:T9SS type A sorting domain-containing protein [bacterium]
MYYTITGRKSKDPSLSRPWPHNELQAEPHMRNILLPLSLLAALAGAALAGGGARPFDPDEPFAHLAWSPDGRSLAAGRQDGGTILLWDGASGTVRDLNAGRSSGNWFAWSPDGGRLAYKTVSPQGQKVVVCDLPSGKRVTVASGPLMGHPVWIDDRTMAYTAGNDVVVRGGDGEQRRSIGTYVNQLTVDRDGRAACFCRGGELCRLDLATGAVEVLYRSASDLFDPQFSPDGGRVLCSTVGHDLLTVEVASRAVTELGDGRFASWRDDRTVIFSRREYRAMALAGSELVAADLASGEQWSIGTGIDFPGRGAVRGTAMVVASLKDGGLLQGAIADRTVPVLRPVPFGVLAEPRWQGQLEPAMPKAAIPGWMPYLHQVYDTPDSFDGSAACGPTSCLMAIGYYHRFAVWNETIHVGANPPGTHVSPYGNYDSKVYTYGGYVFDDTCSPPTGPPAHGAYGYCCTHGSGAWAYKCRDYLRRHDLSSDYDLSVSWADITGEADAGYPVPMSTSITSAGHLMCVRGYIDGQHTVIVNDPAGNRNNGAYWNYPGDNACYDWPGYSNGYVNLSGVSWIVTARGRHTRLALADYPDTVDAGHYYTVTFRDTTSRYQTNNTFTVDVCDGSSGAAVFSANRTGLNDSTGGIWNVFNLTAPRTSSSIYFKSYLTPAGGSYDTRYISAWTDGSPTVVKPVAAQASLANPGLESGTVPWANTENAVLAWDTVRHSGARSLRIVPRVFTDYVPAVAHQDVAVTPGQPYCFSGWARKNDGAGNQVRLCLMWYAAADTQIGSMLSSAWLTADDPAFHYLATDTAVAPAGAAYACLRLYIKGYAAVGDNFDDLSFGPGSGVAGDPPVAQPVGGLTLRQNRPNPFGRSTMIGYQLQRSDVVRLTVYNIAGQLVRTLVDGPQERGRHTVQWDGRDERGAAVGAGMYCYRIEAGGRSDTRRMVVVR